eukprot:CAMPEP_0184659104 /NCGR_PEP_ID=MMETSP0308-20130426/28233_1 /TAXON_ID=38269 /ORGANISM="Gloeochaete witrockiana, Strain SAG 46.84" /LENGTH=327 /DNA_ID=CAMNT_0027098641 /DNA_START=995 /DNA_END=1978 /DNA_ORIENTATION=-
MCLEPIEPDKVKVCGQCHKRAYCSRECQTADYKPGGGGQGHKNWCQLECGEEGIDWKVCPVPGKGLGIVALRDLPMRYRIIVEADRPKHPKALELVPLKGTMVEKFAANSIACPGSRNGGLFLRISRANHDCNANAAHILDETFNVLVLYARRPISVGEEICHQYVQWNEISINRPISDARQSLRSRGIECPPDCICRNSEVEAILDKGRRIEASVPALARSRKFKETYAAIEELLKLYDVINSSWQTKAVTMEEGFQTALLEQNLEKAEYYISRFYEINVAILSPESKRAKRCEPLLNLLKRKCVGRAAKAQLCSELLNEMQTWVM